MRVFNQVITFKYKDTEYKTTVYVRELIPYGFTYFIRFKTGARHFRIWDNQLYITTGNHLERDLLEVLYEAFTTQIK